MWKKQLRYTGFNWLLSFINIVMPSSSVFTALYGMQTRSSDEKVVCPSVGPSVCLSVKRVDCDKTEERSVQIFIPYERLFSLVFWEQEWLLDARFSHLYFCQSLYTLQRGFRCDSWSTCRRRLGNKLTTHCIAVCCIAHGCQSLK